MCLCIVHHRPSRANPNIDTYLSVDALSWPDAAAGKYMRRHGILKRWRDSKECRTSSPERST